MFSRLVKLKRNKTLLALVVAVFCVCLLSFSCVIFDIVQICVTGFNSALLSNAFVGFNIFVMVADVVVIILSVIYILFRKV